MRLPYLLLLIVLTSCSMPSDSIEIIDYTKNVNTTIELQPKQPTHTRIPRPSRTPTNVPMATKVSPTATTAITPTIFDYKSTNLDYSDDPSNPSLIKPQQNKLVIDNSFGDGNKDYVTFIVPENTQITKIILEEYSGEDKIAFFAIQKGGKYTAKDETTEMLIYGHFGPDAGLRTVGNNILIMPNPDVLNTIQEKILNPGQYTMRIQQGSSTDASYTLVAYILQP